MVYRRRLRAVITTLCLYLGAAALIGYFYINAYTGNHGITARQSLDVQTARLVTERDALRAERQRWERRVALLRPQSLDPDMLDERARALLDYVDARDITLMVRRP
jgi:cell division protein FtsB